jgi:hypothetical protein
MEKFIFVSMNQKKIRHITLPLFFVCVFIAISIDSDVWGSAVVSNFHGESGQNKVVLKWISLSEVNCKEYVVERSMDGSNFSQIGTVQAAGNSSERKDYEFQDKSVFKATAYTFYYRLRIIELNGGDRLLSEVVTVTPAISGVRHTWGSIKAMFR